MCVKYICNILTGILLSDTMHMKSLRGKMVKKQFLFIIKKKRSGKFSLINMFFVKISSVKAKTVNNF